MRLDKFLANAGVGSRSQVKVLCKKGLVSVNGNVVKDSDYPIRDDVDEIVVQGKNISTRKKKYIMLNKPAGVVSATQDNLDRTVIECVPVSLRKDLFPVGRLDKDTTGLLLLTDDGVLSHRLLSPKKHVEKEYLVGCAEPVSVEQVASLEKGVDIGEEHLTMPAKVILTEDNTIIHLIIHEGKFHQVKRMMKSVGNEVISLKRLRMGTLMLDELLAPGDYRDLTEDELSKLMESEL